MTRVLFVCLGNICRSPMAEGVFRKLVADAGLDGSIDCESAGTYAYHSGQGADRRARAIAAQHGVRLDGHRARAVERSDFDEFDHLLAMDRQNYDDLLALCPKAKAHKVRMFLSLAPELGIDEVPDPYYGDGDGFERVYAMIEGAAGALLDEIRSDLEPGSGR